MTALTVSEADRVSPADEANAWLNENYDELSSRARACFARRDPEAREEAVAEVLANVSSAAHSAARRGTLNRLTPYHCVVNAVKHDRCGRRITGSSTTDVLSKATQQRRGIRVMSLDQDLDESTEFRLREALADRDAEAPIEVVRREHDYNHMLDNASISDKAKRVFEFLAETHGSGKFCDLAAELMISPGRLTQLKTQLRTALACHGYAGPLGSRPVAQ